MLQVEKPILGHILGPVLDPKYQFWVSRRSITRIAKRVTEAIIEELQDEYFKTPNTVGKWLEISDKFLQWWNSPNAIDGTYIVLEQPKNPDSHYHNYRGTDNTILIEVVDPEYQFLYAEVDMNESNSDGGGLRQKVHWEKHWKTTY